MQREQSVGFDRRRVAVLFVMLPLLSLAACGEGEKDDGR